MDHDQATDIEDSPMEVDSLRPQNISAPAVLNPLEQIPSSSEFRTTSAPFLSLRIPSSSRTRNTTESDLRPLPSSSIYKYANEVEAHESLAKFFERLPDQNRKIHAKNEELYQLRLSVDRYKQQRNEAIESLELSRQRLTNSSEMLEASENLNQALESLLKEKDDRIKNMKKVMQDMLSADQEHGEEIERLQEHLDESVH